MGEFICVCAIDMCEIKPAEVSTCNTRTTGWGSPSATYRKRGGKELQGTSPRWLTSGGERGRGGVAGQGWFLWVRSCSPAGGPIALASWGWSRYFQRGCYSFLHVSFLLHSSCLTCINSRFACMAWDLWEAWNDKTGFVSQPDSLRVCSSGVCLGFQLHHHIQQSLGQSWRKTPSTFNLQTEINTFSAGST